MLVDRLNRPLRDLRISVTDRCNLRCSYCMPRRKYDWIQREAILSFEEISRLARLFSHLGVRKFRITGGEPLLRRDLQKLVAQLALMPGMEDLSLTTNGSLLADYAPALASAGLRRVNVSIDTMNRERFRRMTGRDDLGSVLAGLAAAQECGLKPIKINAVVIRGVNEGDILSMARYSRDHGYHLRLIEYMDVGNANNWDSDKLVSKKEILEIIGRHHPLREIGRGYAGAPSVDYRFEDGAGPLGVVASVTEPFCSGCTRARLTADGRLVTCLFSTEGHDLKALLRSGAPDEAVEGVIRSVWGGREDRYSEQRFQAMASGKGYSPDARKKIEMITLGG